uniref:Uncharacterized protein n=1 Tax=Klebsiella pneumoniae TaxID=573 RepID=A0A6G9HSP1_KLEPN|nr:hypothetical protein [Klebsiella pneumoniae]
MPYSPAKLLPRSATLCVGRDCAHFRHIQKKRKNKKKEKNVRAGAVGLAR